MQTSPQSVVEHFYHPEQTLFLLAVTPDFLYSPQPAASISLLSLFIDLPVWDVSYKWNLIRVQGEGILGIFFFVLLCKFGLFKIQCFLKIEIRSKSHEGVLRQIKWSC